MKFLKILNVRLGLANNSSSSHSLVFLPGPGRDKDVSDQEFGWNFFTAASRQAKTDYLAYLLYYSLKQVTTKELAQNITKTWAGANIFDGENSLETWEDDTIGHINHQSRYDLPSSWDGKGLDKEFFMALKEFILQPDLAILGGNDNVKENHPLAGRHSFKLPLPQDQSNFSKTMVARYDRSGDYWVLFDRDNGSKFRIQFTRESAEKYNRNNPLVPVKSELPELCDIKITDKCSFGCNFCYMGSTKEGNHASYDRIESIARALGKMKVMEAALGGGEPSEHPDFLKILKTFRDEGVVPNFTTFSLAWLNDRKIWEPIVKTAGSFALSCDNPEKVRKLGEKLRENGLQLQGGRLSDDNRLCKVSIQYVMGVTSLETLEKILQEADKWKFPVTLLGYKLNGRGKDFSPHPYDEGWKIIMDLREKGLLPALSIDTALALEWEEKLQQAKIPSWMYHTLEGKFSCYIDGVRGIMAPSSYGKPEEEVTINLDERKLEERLTEVYKQF